MIVCIALVFLIADGAIETDDDIRSALFDSLLLLTKTIGGVAVNNRFVFSICVHFVDCISLNSKHTSDYEN
jgi:hypothetical protein